MKVTKHETVYTNGQMDRNLPFIFLCNLLVYYSTYIITLPRPETSLHRSLVTTGTIHGQQITHLIHPQSMCQQGDVPVGDSCHGFRGTMLMW